MPLLDRRVIFRALQKSWDGDGAPADENLRAWGRRLARAVDGAFPRSIRGHKVMRSGHPWGARNPEYMVDWVWWTEAGHRWEDYRGILVAAECELSGYTNNSRWEDLVKLADVRADLRLFVGAVSHRGGIGKMRSFVRSVARFIRGHRHSCPEDEYLVVLYSKGGNGGSRLHGWLVDGTGCVTTLDRVPQPR